MRVQDNEILTRVGPGTPMGELMRQYWVPAAASSELKPGGSPLRVMLLGEKLVAFRNKNGKVGLMDHRCPHRTASLFFGRNEDDGIRCAYHGWKFGLDGQCQEMPNVPKDKEFSARLKATAYPTWESQGIVWAYMGKRAVPPPHPMLETMNYPDADVQVRFQMRECNYLQGLEGDIDTSHFGFLHLGSVDIDDVDPTDMNKFNLIDRAPEYHVHETEAGILYAAYRPADPGEIYYRYAHFMFPFWTTTPNGTFEDNVVAVAWVPMDDTHTMQIRTGVASRSRPLERLKDGSLIPGLNMRPNPYLPNTTEWFGRFRNTANRSNDYFIDREAQATNVFSGVSGGGVGLQDQAIVESMAPIAERHLEHLASSDRMIVRTRQRMIDAALAFQDKAVVPPAVDDPEVYRKCRSGSLVASADRDWLDIYEERRLASLPKAAE
jgi:phenylpropionate dioxygenase-like ring-hydroxylating dioxygenase large terminal subunit